VQSSYEKIKSVDATAAGDMALVFNYMKMLDPGSTVREGEYANAQNAAGVPDKARNMYNKIINGTLLGEEGDKEATQRRDFRNQADNIFKSNKVIYDNTVKEFKMDAKTIGLPDGIDYTLGYTVIDEQNKDDLNTLDSFLPENNIVNQSYANQNNPF
jgi:hypothetical protein